MARTNAQRCDEAIHYIATQVSAELAIEAAAAIRHRTKDAVGAELSLEGGGYWRHGTDGQHAAVRALLLCHKAFLKAPYAAGTNGQPYDYNMQPDVAKPYFLRKTEEQVKRAIRCYLPIPGATCNRLADVATEIQNPHGGMTWETMTRETDPFPTMPVCFDALKMWLFKAGFVSLRWLSKTGPRMTAQTVNTMLGNGTVIQENQLNNIPRGYLFNFHRAGDMAVCHWGVSLGSGYAAGSNTTANWLGASGAVNFRSGDTHYGEFTLASSLEVCKHKYKMPSESVANVTIRQIDPTTVTTYF